MFVRRAAAGQNWAPGTTLRDTVPSPCHHRSKHHWSHSTRGSPAPCRSVPLLEVAASSSQECHGVGNTCGWGWTTTENWAVPSNGPDAGLPITGWDIRPPVHSRGYRRPTYVDNNDFCSHQASELLLPLPLHFCKHEVEPPPACNRMSAWLHFCLTDVTILRQPQHAVLCSEIVRVAPRFQLD